MSFDAAMGLWRHRDRPLHYDAELRDENVVGKFQAEGIQRLILLTSFGMQARPTFPIVHRSVMTSKYFGSAGNNEWSTMHPANVGVRKHVEVRGYPDACPKQQ